MSRASHKMGGTLLWLQPTQKHFSVEVSGKETCKFIQKWCLISPCREILSLTAPSIERSEVTNRTNTMELVGIQCPPQILDPVSFLVKTQCHFRSSDLQPHASCNFFLFFPWEEEPMKSSYEISVECNISRKASENLFPWIEIYTIV